MTTRRSARRLLVLITSLDAGGAQRHVRDLLAGRPEEFEFHITGGNPGWLAREASRLGVPVHPIALTSTLHPSKDSRAYRELSNLLRHLGPDLVHVHSTKAAFLGRIAASRLGTPVVYTVHGWPFQAGLRSAGALLDLLAEYALRGVAAKVITVSQLDADVARRFGAVPRERLAVIENGIDPSAYEWHVGPYGCRLVYVGRLEQGKGLERLVHALAALRHLPWELTVCGSGSLGRPLEAMARRSGVADRIRFTGWLDDPRPVLAAADCLVLPSDKEGLPYSALEALGCGLFLIVTAVGAFADLHLRNVLRVPPRAGLALHAALRDFLTDGWSDPARQPRQAEVSELLRERFSVARMVDQVGEVYRDVLRERLITVPAG